MRLGLVRDLALSTMASTQCIDLFGGERGWSREDWTASDDRVRGGKSQSYLKIENATATFYGNLDIKTLGGAGFASQRTTGDDKHWDLSAWDAIELLVDPHRSDSKQYAFILKDEILPPDPVTGREQSTTSWEYEFQANNELTTAQTSQLTSVTIPWSEFKPTYRGRERDLGHPLNLTDIRRISIMMRSYFGNQEGDFELCISSIRAVNVSSSPMLSRRAETPDSGSSDSVRKPGEVEHTLAKAQGLSLWQRLFSCNKL